MNRHPVSIGLPVRNGEEFLGHTIDSLLAQSFGDFELLLCDNGSTDATEQICRDTVRRDSRARYLRWSENHGAAANFNHALSYATGDYFRWAAADDLCSPSHLASCVDALSHADEDVVLVYPQTTLIDRTGTIIADYEDDLTLDDPRPSRRLHQLLTNLDLCNPVYGLMRREVLVDAGGMPRCPGAFHHLLAALALRGKFVELETRSFRRRLHGGAPNLTPTKLAAWFDPKKVPPHRIPAFVEHRLRRIVRQAPLGLLDRSLCLWAILRLARTGRLPEPFATVTGIENCEYPMLYNQLPLTPPTWSEMTTHWSGNRTDVA